MTPLVEGGDVVEASASACSAASWRRRPKPGTDEVLSRAGTLLDEKWCSSSRRKASTSSRCVRRSPARRATASAAVLRARPRARPSINIGEAVVSSRRSRSASRARSSRCVRSTSVVRPRERRRRTASNSKIKGTLRFHNLKTVHHEKGHWVAVVALRRTRRVDEFGRERERYKIPYGAVITVKEGDPVQAGPGGGDLGSAHPPGGDRSGRIHQVPGLLDGLTVTSQVDDVTGLSSTVVLDSKQRGRARNCARRSSSWIQAQGMTSRTP